MINVKITNSTKQKNLKANTMIRFSVIALLITLCSCGDKTTPQKPITNAQIDSVSWTKDLNEELSRKLQIIKDSDLRDTSNNVHEFRCYYSPSFENKKYFRLNYLDSTLTIKEYQAKDPSGMGQDSLLSTKQLKFSKEDFLTLDWLMIRSLFWSLNPVVYPYLTIDGISYIYECKQPMPENRCEIKKAYQIVSVHSPKNFDLGNLGQFFAFKGGYKNIYR